jgi:hypothetical protein
VNALSPVKTAPSGEAAGTEPKTGGSAVLSPQPLTTTETAPIQQAPVQPSEEVIVSKSGKKYYFPWCGTIKRIKPENQVHFPSIEAARAAGFLPGGNCKGLK